LCVLMCATARVEEPEGLFPLSRRLRRRADRLLRLTRLVSSHQLGRSEPSPFFKIDRAPARREPFGTGSRLSRQPNQSTLRNPMSPRRPASSVIRGSEMISSTRMRSCVPRVMSPNACTAAGMLSRQAPSLPEVQRSLWIIQPPPSWRFFFRPKPDSPPGFGLGEMFSFQFTLSPSHKTRVLASSRASL